MLSVSEGTVYCIMPMYGLSKINFTDIPNNKLDLVLNVRCNEFPYSGETFLVSFYNKKESRYKG